MDQFIDQDRELGIKNQQKAAAAFFFQKTDQYIANERAKLGKVQNSIKLLFKFHKLISSIPRYLPPCLQKNITTKSSNSPHRNELEKIQVFVQVVPCAECSSCISMDKTVNSITLTDPTPSRKLTTSNAPKSFQVDTVINEDWPLAEICSNTLNNVIRSVANGEDACVLSFGNVSSSENNVMFGSDKSIGTLGIIPCAIMWLFNFLNVIRQHENSRFSVRISATEVSEKQEICRDLLANISSTSNDSSASITFSPLSNPVELRAVDAEKASFYLDYALSERSKSESSGLSHMLITLHVYQYHMQNDSGISGGRSRLQLLDLGHGRLSENNDSNALSIQGISKVLLALYSGQRHIPNSESYLTQLLRKSLMKGSVNIQTSMIFNISGKEIQYNEALQVIQLASKIYRQKLKFSKLSTSTISDDNSSSDSFSFRRMSKTKSREEVPRQNDFSSFYSDLDATSSSDVSCDTVIYRGQRSDRGSADGSSQEQAKLLQLEIEEKKQETKLSLFQQKRKNSTKMNSHVWPKVAVKKASQVMKLGQELWVDGPQAFCTDLSKTELSETNEVKAEEYNSVKEQMWNKVDIMEDTLKLVPNQIKNNNKELPSNRYDYSAKTKFLAERYGNDNVLKSMMVTDWLSKQPEIFEEADIDYIYSTIFKRNLPNKIDVENKCLYDKNNLPILNHRNKTAQTDQPKPQIEVNDRKISLKNQSRIEEWINSVESPNIVSLHNDSGVAMTQSMYSPSCSPFHTSHDHRTFFGPSDFGVSSVPLSYNANSYDCTEVQEHGWIPPYLLSSEIDEELSRLWTCNKGINNKNVKPFDDLNIRSSSFSYKIPIGNTRLEPIRRSYHKTSQAFPTQNEIPNLQSETQMQQGINKIINLQGYSTLPVINNSPKNTKDKCKHNTVENNVKQICENTLKSYADCKKSHKEFKKKETKKGFSFFNQLIRNKKTKKEVIGNRTKKEESNVRAEATNNEVVSQQLIRQKESYLSESVDYVRKAGPPLVLSSPYHMVTSPKTSNPGADSSGHGSDCSSFNGIKAAQVSVNFHPETSGFRFADVHRAGSSGYESVVRDSELSSHNDSASECSAPTNVSVQSPTINKDLLLISASAISTPSITTLSQSLSNNDKEKQDYFSRLQESEKVEHLIRQEKVNILQAEREEVLSDLINAMKFYNIDSEASKKELEKHVFEMDGGDCSSDSIKSTNQSLRSVLSRYQSNISMVTSFLSSAPPEYLCD